MIAGALAACQPPATRYVCSDGSVVEARYPDAQSARITYMGYSISMRIAMSASGARYVGGGWQWWTKGMKQGYLAPLKPGEDIASAPNLDCKAE